MQLSYEQSRKANLHRSILEQIKDMTNPKSVRQYVARATHSAKRVLRAVPGVSAVTAALRPAPSNDVFPGSQAYWEERYNSGGNSGEGSYGQLSRYKANYINDFVRRHPINSVVEFGCGDGNQASLFDFPHYLGVDISGDCVKWCTQTFASRPKWSFVAVPDYDRTIKAHSFDLGMSLDVLYHLVEEDVFIDYLDRLFAAASQFVLIYSSNHEDEQRFHVRSRDFRNTVDQRYSQWQIVEHVPNPYAKELTAAEYGSFASFHVYKRRQVASPT